MQRAHAGDPYCVIGAGSSGLVVAKTLRQQQIPVEVLEREDDVGGNWYYGRPHSSVYKSTHLLSSKRMTQFPDFPMPDDYPDYPGQRQVWEYLRSYARHFGLYDVIRFGTVVERVEPDGDGWQVRLADGSTRHYAGLVIANGHLWDPKYPNYPGHFDGVSLHSGQYKTPEVLAGQRVLVVGAGNSGCDLAVESAQHAEATFHSTRRGYHYMPKYFWGLPADVLNERMLRWRVPLWLRRRIASLLAKMVMGLPQDYGLPRPDHRLLESHPIVNSQMLYYVGHGEIRVKPDVAELCGREVRFKDGTIETIDVVIYCTGFNISFPFIDQAHLNWKDGRPDLYLNVFHPTRDNLFVAGLIQPDSGQFWIVDYQARAIARFIRSQQEAPSRAAAFRGEKAASRPDLGHGIHYLDSTRHLLEIEHFSYRRRIERVIAALS